MKRVFYVLSVNIFNFGIPSHKFSQKFHSTNQNQTELKEKSQHSSDNEKYVYFLRKPLNWSFAKQWKSNCSSKFTFSAFNKLNSYLMKVETGIDSTYSLITVNSFTNSYFICLSFSFSAFRCDTFT